ncbi:MAG: class I SAM-dependent methyltransferase, partial [Luteimonas sp.]|nr:class I SAM-dependent methyltransferase [Luteimonas sp.]
MNQIASTATRKSDPSEFGSLGRLLRRRLLAKLSQLQHGQVVLEDACGSVELGTPSQRETSLRVRMRIRDPRFYRALASHGSVGAGESFMDGDWECDDLVALVRLLVRNRDLLDGMETGLARLGGLALRGAHALRRNTREGSRRNVAAHYDLGNEFFSLFLSPDLMYSSAIWAGDDDTLEAASTRKIDRICQKLTLRPGDHVVEIVTGWG